MTERATGAIVEDATIEHIIDRFRTRIDEVDQDIIDLIKLRQDLSSSIRRNKRRIHRPDIDLSREKEIVDAYVEGLGNALGKEIANAVLHFSKDCGVQDPSH